MGADPRPYDEGTPSDAGHTGVGSAGSDGERPGTQGAPVPPEEKPTGESRESAAGSAVGDAGVAAAGGADAGDADVLGDATDVAAALADVQRQRDEYLDGLQRARAEFDNFRKRMTRERMDALDRGAENVVAGLLRVLDHFGFALDAAEQSADEQLAKGVQMVHTELVAALEHAGLEEIPGVGMPFDPHSHEAVARVEAEEAVDEPMVVEVLRPGYRFKGRVLRPASVKVAH